MMKKSLLVAKTIKTVSNIWKISPTDLVSNIDVAVKNAYLDKHHRYSSAFLKDLHPNNPGHMSGFLFAHQIHMKHCS